MQHYDIYCSIPSEDLQKQNKNCETETFVGVIATYHCNSYYKTIDGIPNFTKICQPNGTWSNDAKVFACDIGNSNRVQ